MSDWGEVKARLEARIHFCENEGSCHGCDDIQAALQRVEELEVDADHEQGLRWLAEMKESGSRRFGHAS